MLSPLLLVLLIHQRTVWRDGVGQLVRYLKGALVDPSSASGASCADIASEPEAWLLTSFVQFNS